MMPQPGKESKYPARPLTENQLAAVVRTVERIHTWNERKRIEALSAKPAPSGRVELAGEIVSRKFDPEGGYNENGSYKILVKCDGFKVWGTCPKNVINHVWPPVTDYDADRGKCPKGIKIKFHATVKPKEDDPAFAIFSRPTKVEIIETVPVITYEVPEIMNREHDDRTMPEPIKYVSTPPAVQRVIDATPVRALESVSETPAVEERTIVQSDAPAPVAKRSGSHSECSHEASKSARAKCRKERAK
jgi:hypothetical protein